MATRTECRWGCGKPPHGATLCNPNLKGRSIEPPDSKAPKPTPTTPSVAEIQLAKEQTFTDLVTRPIKVTQEDGNKVTPSRGRPRIGEAPLTPAEKMRRYRASKKRVESAR